MAEQKDINAAAMAQQQPANDEGRVYWYDDATINLCAFYKSEKCSDTKVWFEDGQFSSHQLLLSAVSPFFKRIYDANPEHLYTIGECGTLFSNIVWFNEFLTKSQFNLCFNSFYSRSASRSNGIYIANAVFW